MKWDELTKQSPPEKEKDMCRCISPAPKHIIISKSLDFWVCTLCKKECHEPCDFKLVNDLDDLFKK